MPRIRPLSLAAATLAVAVLAGCAAPGTDESSVIERNAAGLPVVPEEAGHVHGMAVNPSDGQLYLGTHGGTLIVDGDTITTVGDSTIDLMGFTVAGADHFYASGHPGPDDDLPNPVGLIESTDAGETWTPLSLTGESDFHTLGAAGGQVYGFNGQLVGTNDGRTWTPGAPDVAPASLAIDPELSSRVVATTQHGPALSTDSAATFTHLEDAPVLLFVAWPAPDQLWGVSPEGTVHHSGDAGKTWTEKGDVDAPAAFTAAANGTVVVATQTEILTSTDGAATFSPVAEVTGGGH
ncbi:F510_1955 family glycosylhydrolase [Nocardioides pacificus]